MVTLRESLEDAWKKGELRDLEADLEQFIRRHAQEIRDSAQNRDQTVLRVAGRMLDGGKIGDREMIDLCVRTFLRRCGSVNPKRDILEQAKQISNEIWYEGERLCGPVSSGRQEEIARAWAHLHASRWREWKLAEILFTWEKRHADFMRLIQERGTTDRRPRGDGETTARRGRRETS